MSVHGGSLSSLGRHTDLQQRGVADNAVHNHLALFRAVVASTTHIGNALQTNPDCYRTSRRRIARKPSSGTLTGTARSPKLLSSMLCSASRHDIAPFASAIFVFISTVCASRCEVCSCACAPCRREQSPSPS